MVSRLGPKYQDVVDMQHHDGLTVVQIVDTSICSAGDEPLRPEELVYGAEAGNRRRPETVQPCVESPNLLFLSLVAFKPFGRDHACGRAVQLHAQLEGRRSDIHLVDQHLIPSGSRVTCTHGVSMHD